MVPEPTVTLTPATVLLMIGFGSSVATAIFWGAFHLGEIKQKLRSAHERLDDHDEKIGELQARRRTDHQAPWGT